MDDFRGGVRLQTVGEDVAGEDVVDGVGGDRGKGRGGHGLAASAWWLEPGHRGGIRGYESAMFHFPQDGVTVVLVSNQGNWNTDVPMNMLVKTVLGSN